MESLRKLISNNDWIINQNIPKENPEPEDLKFV